MMTMMTRRLVSPEEHIHAPGLEDPLEHPLAEQGERLAGLDARNGLAGVVVGPSEEVAALDTCVRVK